MKRKYEEPEATMVMLEAEDIVMESYGDGGEGEPDYGGEEPPESSGGFPSLDIFDKICM